MYSLKNTFRNLLQVAGLLYFGAALSACAPVGGNAKMLQQLNPTGTRKTPTTTFYNSTTTTTLGNSTTTTLYNSTTTTTLGNSTTTTTLNNSGCNAAFCLNALGLQHVSSPTTPGKTYNFRKAGQYTNIHVSFDVEIPQWYTAPGFNNHLYGVFWLTKNGSWRDLVGYGLIQGNGYSGARMRWGFGMSAANKYLAQTSYKAKAPNEYHFDYDYNYNTQKIVIAIQGADGSGTRLSGTGGLNLINLNSSDRIEMIIGSGFSDGPEAPTFGWKFYDVRVEMN